jgi:demethylmenaquinone methyltransferase/2-methoxy-6-polyprenyl-1,4-benzoquinol methylase
MMAVDMPNDQSRGRSPLPERDEKHAYVRAMFDAIAPRYDLLNSLLSARLHHRWRRAAAAQAGLKPGDTALDVCTGTGDLAVEMARLVGPTGRVIGGDFSLPMLRRGRLKGARRAPAGVIRMALADAQALPFPVGAFDAAAVGFGIRNVVDMERALREMARVVRAGGRVVLLEFNQPRHRAFAALYRWYSFRVLPVLGGLISGRRSAYEYLPSSVAAFPSREAIAEMMGRAGLADVRVTDLTFGTVVVHRGVKQP